MALDAALSALEELVPQYAAKLKDKRWLKSKASSLENTSEACFFFLVGKTHTQRLLPNECLDMFGFEGV